MRITNKGHETLRVRYSGDPSFEHFVPALNTAEFATVFGHSKSDYFIVDRVPIKRFDSRVDPRGGDPYNRIGAKAFA